MPRNDGAHGFFFRSQQGSAVPFVVVARPRIGHAHMDRRTAIDSARDAATSVLADMI